MKAALLEQLGSLTVREVADPQPGPYDALCVGLYGATCTGTDMHLIEGRVDWAIQAAPTIIGHESIGQVIEVGENVRNYKVGDLVTRVGAPPAADGSHSSTWGGFASMGVAIDHWAIAEDGAEGPNWCQPEVNQVIPEGFDPRACTMMTTWRETLSYATRMGVAAGENVLVIGSGGVGLAFAAHATNLGAGRIVMVGNPARSAVAERVGVSDYIDYKADDVAGALADLAGNGFDAVIDAVGSQTTIDLSLGALAAGSKLGVYGIEEMGKTSVDSAKARGEFTEHDGYDESETHEQVVDLMRTGKLDASIWIDVDQPFDLDDINAAFDAVRSRQAIKALVKLS
ncbi:MAG: zinc-dependent alcohol dehydrogenase [Planctomycetota bacterium]|jgi:threonine dehydrogenase-like Zn-dependent dehydrogenase